jgi:predicted small lipoprotein YifL
MNGRFAGISTVLLLAVVFALSACGRKGDLQPPEGEKSAYTGLGTYPAPDSVVPQDVAPVGDPEANPEDDSETDPESESGKDGGGS